MDGTQFLSAYLAHEAQITRIYECAAQIHADVNQYYGGDLPYAFHLKLAASYVTRFGHLVINDVAEIQTLYAAIYFHDSLEDARLTYNDLTKVFQKLNAEGCNINVEVATEAVYALTNDKGRTRAERAGEKYYQGIRETPYAPFIKLADRLANISYSSSGNNAANQHMKTVYRNELPHFLDALTTKTADRHFGLPRVMIDEIKRIITE